MLGIHPDTLYKAVENEYKMTFTAYSQEKKAEGRELLRKKQFDIALDGDKTMLVWLGKQYLGQTDKSEVDTNLKGSGLKIGFSDDND